MKYKVDYEKSKSKFITLLKGVTIKSKFYNLDLLLKRTTKSYLETEWEFPKGRKNNNEKNSYYQNEFNWRYCFINIIY